ncbi:hypothetical protein PN498_20710 [Oscillatoria sp. CS-180]|uniref:hypothetical protein n=1 Tax=Oscillatoria sp. CS-180 TaxID=3021720 RepID=UPI00232D2B9B|nr:hypothetical protein [Oscillatoria sp. CS-180]MDB9528426.1 hypothetical protein [Oscillatoria sp. CS-180]
MARFTLIALLMAILVSSAASLAVAESPQDQQENAPVIAQLQLRDHTVVITSDDQGKFYSVYDNSGTSLSAGLTEQEIADQYPELFDLLRPAIADGENGELMMMLAPVSIY